jgi:hypothetical protein
MPRATANPVSARKKHGSIYWKLPPPPPRGKISANVNRGENMIRQREKGENIKEKGSKGKEKERKGEK